MEKYLDYLDNSGGVTIEQFDEDWEPIGPMIRSNPLFKAQTIFNYECNVLRRKL